MGWQQPMTVWRCVPQRIAQRSQLNPLYWTGSQVSRMATLRLVECERGHRPPPLPLIRVDRAPT